MEKAIESLQSSLDICFKRMLGCLNRSRRSASLNIVLQKGICSIEEIYRHLCGVLAAAEVSLGIPPQTHNCDFNDIVGSLNEILQLVSGKRGLEMFSKILKIIEEMLMTLFARLKDICSRLVQKSFDDSSLSPLKKSVSNFQSLCSSSPDFVQNAPNDSELEFTVLGIRFCGWKEWQLKELLESMLISIESFFFNRAVRYGGDSTIVLQQLKSKVPKEFHVAFSSFLHTLADEYSESAFCFVYASYEELAIYCRPNLSAPRSNDQVLLQVEL